MTGGVLEQLAEAVADLRERVAALQDAARAPSGGVWAAGAVPVKRAVREYGVSRTALYRLMDAGELPWAKPAGTRERLVPRAWLAEYLDRHGRRGRGES